MTTLNHSIKFTSANFGDATGISVHNLTSGEDVNTVTQTSVTPALVMHVDATWITDPVAGDTLEARYASGNLVSVDGVPTAAFTGPMINCLDVALNKLRTVKSMSYVGSKWTKQTDVPTEDESYNAPWIPAGNVVLSGPSNNTVTATTATTADRSYMRNAYTIPANTWVVFSVELVSISVSATLVSFIVASNPAGTVTGDFKYDLPANAEAGKRYGFRFRTDTNSPLTFRAGINPRAEGGAIGTVAFKNPQVQIVENFENNAFDDWVGKPATRTSAPGNTFEGGGNSGKVVSAPGTQIPSIRQAPYALIFASGDSFTTTEDDFPALAAETMKEGYVMGKGYTGGLVTGIIGQNYAANLAFTNYTATIIEGGINDIISDVSAADIEAAIETMAAQAEAAGLSGREITIVNISGFLNHPNWTSTRQIVIDTTNALRLAFANANGYTHIDMYDIVGDPADKRGLLPAFDSGDNLHLNVAGAQAVADAIVASQV